MADFINFSGMEAEISKLMDDMDAAKKEVEEAMPEAAMEAAEIIRAEQQRLLSKANFKRDKPNHQYNNVNGGLIKIMQDRTRNRRYKVKIGYDSETLRKYPELRVIEFGRPGKSARHSKKTDKLGRKKGEFPSHISHIRAGFFLAKDKAADACNEKLMQAAKNAFRKK